MFDIAWSELLIIAVVALLVVGPKDLPHMLRAFGRTVGKLRRTGDEFRREFEASLREAGGDELSREINDIRQNNPFRQMHRHLDEAMAPPAPTILPPVADGDGRGAPAADGAAWANGAAGADSTAPTPARPAAHHAVAAPMADVYPPAARPDAPSAASADFALTLPEPLPAAPLPDASVPSAALVPAPPHAAPANPPHQPLPGGLESAALAALRTPSRPAA